MILFIFLICVVCFLFLLVNILFSINKFFLFYWDLYLILEGRVFFFIFEKYWWKIKVFVVFSCDSLFKFFFFYVI